MAAAQQMVRGIVKIEDSTSPEAIFIPTEPVPVVDNTTPPVIDSRDPECFLKRCSGFNKKTKYRCHSVIGKKPERSCHLTFLPTCRTHRDQESFAGWCQYQHAGGERCGRLFRWTRPYLELCTEHQGHPDTPCYFFKLPVELRHEVFRYLLPDRAIGNSTAALHGEDEDILNPNTVLGAQWWYIPQHLPHNALPHVMTERRYAQTMFPMPVLDLFLVNRQFYAEVKDLLFSTVPFTIDVRKDGTFMCGRRLLEPRRADGSAHVMLQETDEAKQRFLRYFDWAAVKHYNVDILVENAASGSAYPKNSTWDEEVELYDIRDYISVVVSGVLAKSHSLCKLQVQLCLADFAWPSSLVLTNTRLLAGPFESLRNVRAPQLLGVATGRPYNNEMLTVPRPPHCRNRARICSVPRLPSHTLLLAPGTPAFDSYAASWTRWISARAPAHLTPRPPIRTMFTAFKDFYSELAGLVPEVAVIQGRRAFLHRARVAREQEDVEGFRALRNEAIAYWYVYLEREERKKERMERRLGSMLEGDVYPASAEMSGFGIVEEVLCREKIEAWQRSGEKAGSGRGESSGGQSSRGQKLQLRSPTSEQVSPKHQLGLVNTGCLAHDNLSADWYAEPGPSTKKRRVDSGFSEMVVDEESVQVPDVRDTAKEMYAGKGKGKMGTGVKVEVICID